MSMVQTVLNTLNSNPGLISTSPALGSVMTQLQLKTEEVQLMLQNYEASDEWRTIEKDNLLKSAIDETHALAKIMRAYASSVNEQNLYNRMNFTKESLRMGGINGTLLRMKEVMDTAGELLSALVNFGYDNMRFTAFTQLYDGLHSRKVAPREAIVDHKALGAQIKQQVKAIDEIIELQLDAILLVLKPTDETFYVKYKSARKMIHSGGKNGPKGATPPIQ